MEKRLQIHFDTEKEFSSSLSKFCWWELDFCFQKLKMKLAECERQSPSFLFDLTKQLINQSELNVNLQVHLKII